MFRIVLIAVFGLFTDLSTAIATEKGPEAGKLRLDTSEAPPYQVLVNGELSGLSVSILHCVLADMNQPYEIQILPWARAVNDLKQGGTDGIFTAMPASDFNNLAEMSAPFALEKWYWFTRADKPHEMRDKELIGGIRSSNQVAWMKEHGVFVDAEVNDLNQLIRLLLSGRIDRFLADERIVDEALIAMELDGHGMVKHFSRYMPLGIYFSNAFLKKRPEFMADFNNHLAGCSPGVLVLTEDENRHISGLVDSTIKPLFQKADIFSLISQTNNERKHWSDNYTAEADELWQYGKDTERGEKLIEDVLLNPVAEQFRRDEVASGQLFSEVILTDSSGRNAAVSHVTTDFNQGDEVLYKRAIRADGKTVLSSISYDESSQRFQVKAAFTLGKGDALGVAIIGLNIEEALRALDSQLLDE